MGKLLCLIFLNLSVKKKICAKFPTILQILQWILHWQDSSKMNTITGLAYSLTMMVLVCNKIHTHTFDYFKSHFWVPMEKLSIVSNMLPIEMWARVGMQLFYFGSFDQHTKRNIASSWKKIPLSTKPNPYIFLLKLEDKRKVGLK